ncbi:pectate lyase [Pseudoxanthomonas sp. F37]|uniref:pectate lyase n=1 Tax=Pseudoxanthomonas TaxID=83618 RepID=UPI001FD5FBCB|nr:MULTISPECIES: pectate lyase [Pseudoxanthomonas]UOV06698.1 pectate lyase [Pseudoxanthomonas mexicana]UOV08309.1 pectate lyase [Pseudoxanthomonas sp. F37]
MHARLLVAGLACLLAPVAGAETIPAPSLAGFEDAIHHWRNVHGDAYPRYLPEDVAKIADNILRYQRVDGGWIENQDPARILDDAEKARFDAEARKSGGSFDNRNIYTQLDYLATAYAITGDVRYRDGSLKGLQFTLAQQIPSCGGWPHTVPATQSYHPHITLADDVTAGVLGTLRKVLTDRRRYAFIDAPLRARVKAAVDAGDACLLRLQVRQGDTLAGWAGQYDARTLHPAQGRAFELPSITGQETVGVVRYLMSIPDPSPEVVKAVDGAVAWLRRMEITGWRIETFDAPAEQFQYHSSVQDRRLVADPSASGLWARFYDVNDNSVVLATRDSQRVARYQDIPRERRTGYEWYGHWPERLLSTEYPQWTSHHASSK